MDIKKAREDVLEYIESTLSDASSFGELFDEKDSDMLLGLVESDELADEIIGYIDEEEYGYFTKSYLEAMERILQNADEEDLISVLVQLDEAFEDDDYRNNFFNW